MFLGVTYSGKAADTWAVGVTLYCMILGEYPFLGDTLQDTYDRVRDLVCVLFLFSVCVFFNYDFFLYNELFCFYSSFETCFHPFLYKISKIGNKYFVIIITRKAYQLEKETRQTKHLSVFDVIIPSLHVTCFLPDPDSQ